MISATMQPEFAVQGKAKRYSQRALKLKKDDPKLWLLGAAATAAKVKGCLANAGFCSVVLEGLH